MNVKPGDLAVTVGCKNRPDVNGIIVTVVGPGFHAGSWLCAGHEIERIASMYGSLPSVWDKNLRPIRDQDGEDEILRIVGKPQEVTA